MAPTPSPTEEDFTGFANAPVGRNGNLKDFRDVPAYKPRTEADKIREASQTTESSIVAFKTEGKGTNGAPAAVVVPRTPETDEESVKDEPAAEGEEGKQS